MKLTLSLVLFFAECGPHNSATCSWRQMRADSLYEDKWFCVSPEGAIRGEVNHVHGEQTWAAFIDGGYCLTGSGFISRQAAMDCIDKRLGNKMSAAEAAK